MDIDKFSSWKNCTILWADHAWNNRCVVAFFNECGKYWKKETPRKSYPNWPKPSLRVNSTICLYKQKFQRKKFYNNFFELMSPCIVLTDLELTSLNIVSPSLSSSHDHSLHPSLPSYPTLSFPPLCSPHQAQFVLSSQSFELAFTYGIWQTFVRVTSLKKNVFFLSQKSLNDNRSSVGGGVGFHSHLPSCVLGFFFLSCACTTFLYVVTVAVYLYAQLYIVSKSSNFLHVI